MEATVQIGFKKEQVIIVNSQQINEYFHTYSDELYGNVVVHTPSSLIFAKGLTDEGLEFVKEQLFFLSEIRHQDLCSEEISRKSKNFLKKIKKRAEEFGIIKPDFSRLIEDAQSKEDRIIN